ncbi:MAG: hypothetical protein R3F20_02110 [Planctomycetota bacterium]
MSGTDRGEPRRPRYRRPVKEELRALMDSGQMRLTLSLVALVIAIALCWELWGWIQNVRMRSDMERMVLFASFGHSRPPKGDLDEIVRADIRGGFLRHQHDDSARFYEYPIDEVGHPIDCWGTKFKIKFMGGRLDPWVVIWSAGRDRRFNSDDDLVVIGALQ